ncbi:MAG: hypothetical protein ACI9MR_004736 [Myxococcota bacterium]|jgi:hypothetical protein
MNGPVRFRDDPDFERRTGVRLTAEADALSAHDVAGLRRLVLAGAARGATPRVDPTAHPGALKGVLMALGTLTAAGALWLATDTDQTSVGPSASVRTTATRTAAPTGDDPLTMVSITATAAVAEPTGYCSASAADLAPVDPAARSPLRRPRRRWETHQACVRSGQGCVSTTTRKQPGRGLVTLAEIRTARLLGDLELRLALPSTPCVRGCEPWDPLAKDLVSALLTSTRLKVFK